MPAGSVLLQLGAFANADNAETMRVRMSRELDWAEADLRINTSGGIPTASRALSGAGRGGKKLPNASVRTTARRPL